MAPAVADDLARLEELAVDGLANQLDQVRIVDDRVTSTGARRWPCGWRS